MLMMLASFDFGWQKGWPLMLMMLASFGFGWGHKGLVGSAGATWAEKSCPLGFGGGRVGKGAVDAHDAGLGPRGLWERPARLMLLMLASCGFDSGHVGKSWPLMLMMLASLKTSAGGHVGKSRYGPRARARQVERIRVSLELPLPEMPCNVSFSNPKLPPEISTFQKPNAKTSLQ